MSVPGSFDPRQPSSGTGRRRSSRRRRFARLVCEALEDRILPAQIFWNVDADGFWNVAGNWRDDQGVSRLPEANDDVIIDRPGGDFTVTFRDAVSSVHSLTARERLVVGQLGTTSMLTISGAVDATA